MQLARRPGLDIIRTFAIIFVPSVHFFLNTHFYSVPLKGYNMFLQVFMRNFFLICVPLFLILTGYLQGNKKPEKKYFIKILPIILIYLIYSVVSIFVRELIFKDHHSIFEWLIQLVQFKADEYSWYINMYVGLFLLSPYLNLIYNHLSSKKDKWILISVLLMITSVPELLNGKLRGLIFLPNYWIAIYPITYYFIGCFIKEFQFKIKRAFGIPLLILVGLISSTIEFYYAKGGKFASASGYYPSLLVVLLSVIFFLLLYNIKLQSNKLSKFFSLFSILSLDIYLASYIVDQFVYRIIIHHYFHSQPQILVYFVPAVFATLLFSFIISFTRYKLIRLR